MNAVALDSSSDDDTKTDENNNNGNTRIIRVRGGSLKLSNVNLNKLGLSDDDVNHDSDGKDDIKDDIESNDSRDAHFTLYRRPTIVRINKMINKYDNNDDITDEIKITAWDDEMAYSTHTSNNNIHNDSNDMKDNMKI
eukprot:CAMPEP_0114697344 /NCGR_PEP_ID=MMETSP0191-20121206/73682_1 /TAXON_ID=126664 /ORGANISM="Sorites sp." /LENGTH=137 /DNA_ID=CAMNT_0001996329 /DNA_START=111 /DNA_END=525 /DNA_ORIENTATION=-